MATLLPEGKQSFTNSAGAPLVGGKVYTYDAGTNNPRVTYQDAAGTVPNTNPVVLDARGEATIFWSGTYKVVLKDASDVTIWTVDNVSTTPDGGKSSDLQTRLANAASIADGDAMLAVKRTTAGALATTQHVINENRMIDLVADFGLIGDGVSVGNVAKLVTATAAGGDFWLPAGNYLWDADFTLPSSTRIYFAKGAKLLASANNRIFFKTTANTFFSQVFFPVLDGNGFTGVTGFDYTSARHSSGIYWPVFANLVNGIILRQLCWDFEIVNPFGQGITNPIQVMDGSSAVRIEKPGFDGLGSAGIGIKITTGPAYATTSVRIVGGYIQGYTYGVSDNGIGTVIDSTYFEVNTLGDVLFNGAKAARAKNCQHYADIGPVCYKSVTDAPNSLLPSDGVVIEDPVMTSGSRSLGLFNFDSTNANCYYRAPPTAGGLNLPVGTVVGIGTLPTEDSGTFTPVIEGSTAAGVGTYTTQSGTWRRIGKRVSIQIQVAWTAHTGTGNILVLGAPVALTPVSFTPTRMGQLIFADGVTVMNPILYATFQGAGTNISLVQVSTLGAAALIPIAATGTININFKYDL